MAKFKSIFEELCTLFDTKPKKKEDTQSFLKRFMKHAHGELEDNDKLWAKMTEPAQDWYNEAVDAMEAKKSLPVPKGMDAGGDDDEDGDDKPKAKRGRPSKAEKAEKSAKRSKRRGDDEDDEDSNDDDDAPNRKKAKGKDGKAKKGNGVKRESKFSDDMRITLKVKENPKREGTASYDRFEIYFDKKVKTVGDALAKGLTRGDLAWDSHENRGYIEIG
jgi:hypothetical protein